MASLEELERKYGLTADSGVPDLDALEKKYGVKSETTTIPLTPEKKERIERTTKAGLVRGPTTGEKLVSAAEAAQEGLGAFGADFNENIALGIPAKAMDAAGLSSPEERARLREAQPVAAVAGGTAGIGLGMATPAAPERLIGEAVERVIPKATGAVTKLIAGAAKPAVTGAGIEAARAQVEGADLDETLVRAGRGVLTGVGLKATGKAIQSVAGRGEARIAGRPAVRDKELNKVTSAIDDVAPEGMPVKDVTNSLKKVFAKTPTSTKDKAIADAAFNKAENIFKVYSEKGSITARELAAEIADMPPGPARDAMQGALKNHAVRSTGSAPPILSEMTAPTTVDKAAPEGIIRGAKDLITGGPVRRALGRGADVAGSALSKEIKAAGALTDETSMAAKKLTKDAALLSLLRVTRGKGAGDQAIEEAAADAMAAGVPKDTINGLVERVGK